MLFNYLFAVLTIALSFVLTALAAGGGLRYFLDLPSVIILIIIPLVYQLALFGPAGFKRAFAAPFRREVSLEQVISAQLFFKAYNKITWIAAFIAVLIGLIAILAHLEDPKLLGPNLAVMLVSLLYAGIMNGILILPLSLLLKRRLIELNTEV